MILKAKTTFTDVAKSNSSTTYEGRPVTVITIFSDNDIAMIEDENGNILDVKKSLIKYQNPKI